MEDLNTLNTLNTKWILWYHDPLDTNWKLVSYKNLQEISTIQDFWEIYKFLDNIIIENSMLFLMREGINPLWEDIPNMNGGSWSFKVTKGNLYEVWLNLSIHLCGETLIANKNNYNLINGISISPKKNFCIIKIWNRDKKKNKISFLNKIDHLPFETVIYKDHQKKY